jgi:NAD+ synthase
MPDRSDRDPDRSSAVKPWDETAWRGDLESSWQRPRPSPDDLSPLEIDPELVESWLVEFLRDELSRRRGFKRVVVGLSGGVDSTVTAALSARALGPEAVLGFLLPYRTSSDESRAHAELVAEWLGIGTRTISITDAVDGYLARFEPDASDHRRGNVAARQRMIILFDQAAKLHALPVGTGNKSERLLGYFTWHADDSPPINPLGDLFKSQVWALARGLGVPAEIVDKPATADLIRGQTDESDLGISYPEADLILHYLLTGYSPTRLADCGFEPEKIGIVRERLESTHWKRHLPTVAMLSETTIGEWYLRPVDY